MVRRGQLRICSCAWRRRRSMVSESGDMSGSCSDDDRDPGKKRRKAATASDASSITPGQRRDHHAGRPGASDPDDIPIRRPAAAGWRSRVDAGRGRPWQGDVSKVEARIDDQRTSCGALLDSCQASARQIREQIVATAFADTGGGPPHGGGEAGRVAAGSRDPARTRSAERGIVDKALRRRPQMTSAALEFAVADRRRTWTAGRPIAVNSQTVFAPERTSARSATAWASSMRSACGTSDVVRAKSSDSGGVNLPAPVMWRTLDSGAQQVRDPPCHV